MTRRGAVALLAVVAGIASKLAASQVLATFKGVVTEKKEAAYQACLAKHEKQNTITFGCMPPDLDAPFWCEINADNWGGIRIVSGKETIEITMAEVMEALRPLPENVEPTCVKVGPGQKWTIDACSTILKK